MGDNPNWVFYRHDGPTETEVMSRLIAEFPGLRPRWEKHLESWRGESPGHYFDIALFAHFGKEAFIPFLGPKSREAWDDLEKLWAGKHIVR